MLKEYRFVFVREKGLEVPAGISGGDGAWRSRMRGVHRELWRSALAKDTRPGKALAEEKNAKVVLVTDGIAMESW